MSTALLPQRGKKDTWYKEPWLLLVAGGPLVVVCASLFTGFLAMHGSDKVVADDYYKQGLMINKDIQRDARARELKMSAVLSEDFANGKIKLDLSGKGELPDSVQLSLAASGNANSVSEVIRRMPMNRIAPGKYEGELKLVSNISLSSAKLLHVKLETTDWRLTGSWFEPKQQQVHLIAGK